MRMRHIFTYSSIIIILIATIVPGATHVAAEDVSEINKQIDELKEEQSSISSQQDELSDKKGSTEEKIKENEARQQQVREDISKIDNNLAETQSKLTAKQEEIDTTNSEIEATELQIDELIANITDLKERIATREELLKNRLRNLQKNGGDISYFQVLMGAKSFGDFINRITAVSKIMDQDKSIIETNNQEKADLEVKQTSLETKQADLEEAKIALEEQQSELETLQASLNNQMESRQQLMGELEEEHHQLEEITVTLEMEQEVLQNEKAALEKAIKQAEQKKKDEEERLAQLSADNNSEKPSSGSGTSSGSSDGGGMFAWPAGATYVSSEFGHRWGDLHKGMDIAAGGTVPIYAAEDGVVSMANHYSPYSGWWSYGNFVMITHWVNGQQYTTVYAHMRSFNVRNEQTVQRGQQIGIMGNTGNSFGQHLHFEVHKGGYSGDSSALNPRSFLN